MVCLDFSFCSTNLRFLSPLRYFDLISQVKEFDTISRLDQWLTTMLLRIKKTIQDDESDLRWFPHLQNPRALNKRFASLSLPWASHFHSDRYFNSLIISPSALSQILSFFPTICSICLLKSAWLFLQIMVVNTIFPECTEYIISCYFYDAADHLTGVEINLMGCNKKRTSMHV